MTTLLSLKRPERYERRETVKLADGSDFTLILRQPSFEVQIEDMESQKRWSRRFEKLIVGWEGVNVEGENGEPTPLGYSPDNFKTICENYPTVFNQACALIVKVINDLPDRPDEESGKNSSAPSEDSLAPDGKAETSKSTEKSNDTSG